MNQFTKYLTFSIDFLFLKQPARTSIGFIFGVSINILFKMFAAWSSIIQTILDAKIPFWQYGLLGIVFFHIPSMIGLLFNRYNHLSEAEEKALAMIKALNIPDFQKQEMFLRIVEKVLERVELKPELRSEINRPVE